MHTSSHLSTRQYARLVHRWIASIGLNDTAYGTHTMRRTKASLIYRRTKNLRAVQLLLGHTKLESTVRYLGIEVDDALEMAEQTEAHGAAAGERSRAGQEAMFGYKSWEATLRVASVQGPVRESQLRRSEPCGF